MRRLSPSATPAAKLLRWYDAHKRDLPWRSDDADPYRVWLSEIMLQQTTTTAVAPYFARFLARWPDVTSLAAAEESEVLHAWAGLGYYARARNLLACARMIAGNYGGRFPDTEAGLRKLPGIGVYTAAAIAAIAFGRRAVVVDGNVERVVSRLFAIETPLPVSRPQIRTHADALTPDTRPGDFAQAMMDLGATLCTPTRPACILCPLCDDCAARQAGVQSDLPRKTARATRPTRFGTAFVAIDHDMILVRTREASGLLGGMTEFPGQWPNETREMLDVYAGAPFKTTWRETGVANHGFTHFDVELTVFRADLTAATAVEAPLRWVALAHLANEALPTLMLKVAAAGDVPITPLSATGVRGRARGLREPVHRNRPR